MVAEEQAAVFESGSHQWCTDATIEPLDALGLERFPEAIEWPIISERVAAWLGLKSHLDRVKWVLNELASDSCSLASFSRV
jgi:hypothetical protein